jgi:hypothetical protein
MNFDENIKGWKSKRNEIGRRLQVVQDERRRLRGEQAMESRNYVGLLKLRARLVIMFRVTGKNATVSRRLIVHMNKADFLLKCSRARLEWISERFKILKRRQAILEERKAKLDAAIRHYQLLKGGIWRLWENVQAIMRKWVL